VWFSFGTRSHDASWFRLCLMGGGAFGNAKQEELAGLHRGHMIFGYVVLSGSLCRRTLQFVTIFEGD
jgi:hypothetical protein